MKMPLRTSLPLMGAKRHSRHVTLGTRAIRSKRLFLWRLGLVAGGGFVPQSVIDSSELIDSTIVRNAKNGHKGKLFIQFSFSSSGFVIPSSTVLFRPPTPSCALRGFCGSSSQRRPSSRNL